ncbi:MAG: hypothetical protein ACRD1U_14655, partial [Vicinamibacterales bacterium]
VRNSVKWLQAWFSRKPAVRAEEWLGLVYYVGYCRGLRTGPPESLLVADADSQNIAKLGAPAVRN